MIEMFCDRCGEKIPSNTNGGVRVRTANRELSAHLCQKHQQELRELVQDFCETNAAREVQPSLKF